MDGGDIRPADADQVVGAAWSTAWDLPPLMLPSVWAEKHRVLPQQSSAESGPWRNSRTPYLIEIMDSFSPDDPTEFVVFRKPTQCGGSEVIFNILGWLMSHAAPAAILLAVPGRPMAKRHVRQRINPSIKACPVWQDAVSGQRHRGDSDTMFEKDFRGAGLLLVGTANSSTDLSSMPVRYELLDEVSKWPKNLDGEGSALGQAIGRSTSFQGLRKVFMTSSPTVDGQCQISEQFELGDQRSFHVPCPHCQQRHTLEFERLQPDGHMVCPHCGATFDESHKTAMMDRGRWIAKHPGRAIRSFDLNALYTPHRLGDSWADLAQQLERAKTDPAFAITFSQQKRGKPYKGERDKQDAEELKARAELDLVEGVVPEGYYRITSGVDCQADRFEINFTAWGAGEHGVVLKHQVVDGDPDDPVDGYVALDAALQQQWRCGAGHLIAENVAMDGGNWSEKVAGFVRTRQRRTIKCGDGWRDQAIVLVRGRSAASLRVVHRPAKTEVNSRGRVLTTARAVGMWGVGTEVAKTILMGRITKDAELEPARRWLRFAADLPPAFYLGLTSESYDRQLGTWVHDRRIRNEPLDCLVYAYFAALHPNVRLDLVTETEWAQLRDRYHPAIPDLFGPVQPVALAVKAPAALPAPPAPPRPAAAPAPLPTSFARPGWSRRL